MRIVILGNGAWTCFEHFRSRLRKGDFIVACDGALRKALSNGLAPHAVLGDLDSLKGAAVPAGIRIIRFPPEKDETDADLAVRFSVSEKPREMLWYAPFGSRWDHNFANYALLGSLAKHNIRVLAVQGRWSIWALRRSFRFCGTKGDRVSLLPWTDTVRGVSTKGLQYPLRGESLHRERTRGVSNLLTADEAAITMKEGILVVLHERK